VWTLPVVPEKPINKFVVEGFNIISHESSVVLEKLFVECPVESFNMCVHLR
jgi:hypothetical protein